MEINDYILGILIIVIQGWLNVSSRISNEWNIYCTPIAIVGYFAWSWMISSFVLRVVRLRLLISISRLRQNGAVFVSKDSMNSSNAQGNRCVALYLYISYLDEDTEKAASNDLISVKIIGKNKAKRKKNQKSNASSENLPKKDEFQKKKNLVYSWSHGSDTDEQSSVSRASSEEKLLTTLKNFEYWSDEPRLLKFCFLFSIAVFGLNFLISLGYGWYSSLDSAGCQFHPSAYLMYVLLGLYAFVALPILMYIMRGTSDVYHQSETTKVVLAFTFVAYFLYTVLTFVLRGNSVLENTFPPFNFVIIALIFIHSATLFVPMIRENQLKQRVREGKSINSFEKQYKLERMNDMPENLVQDSHLLKKPKIEEKRYISFLNFFQWGFHKRNTGIKPDNRKASMFISRKDGIVEITRAHFLHCLQIDKEYRRLKAVAVEEFTTENPMFWENYVWFEMLSWAAFLSYDFDTDETGMNISALDGLSNMDLDPNLSRGENLKNLVIQTLTGSIIQSYPQMIEEIEKLGLRIRVKPATKNKENSSPMKHISEIDEDTITVTAKGRFRLSDLPNPDSEQNNYAKSSLFVEYMAANGHIELKKLNMNDVRGSLNTESDLEMGRAGLNNSSNHSINMKKTIIKTQSTNSLNLLGKSEPFLPVYIPLPLHVAKTLIKIYKRFLRSNSSFELNLPHWSKSQLRKTMETLDSRLGIVVVDASTSSNDLGIKFSKSKPKDITSSTASNATFSNNLPQIKAITESDQGSDKHNPAFNVNSEELSNKKGLKVLPNAFLRFGPPKGDHYTSPESTTLIIPADILDKVKHIVLESIYSNTFRRYVNQRLAEGDRDLMSKSTNEI